MTAFELVKAFLNLTPEMEQQIREAMKFDPDMEVLVAQEYDGTDFWTEPEDPEVVTRNVEVIPYTCPVTKAPKTFVQI